MRIFNRKLTLIIVLIVISSFVYFFNLQNRLFWDDNDWIVNNPLVHSLSWHSIKTLFTSNVLKGIGLSDNYYRPFLFLTFALNFIISGIKPLGYHLFSNGLHILNGILIFMLFDSVLKRRLAAFIAALVFLIHPLQTEAVTYISGRGDPLHLFLMLGALFLYYRAERSSSRFLSWQRVSSLLLFVFALLSQEKAILLPFLLMIFHIAFLSEHKFLKSLKEAFIKALPYFTLAFIYGILRLTVLNFVNTLNFYEISNVYSEHLYVRLFTFLHALLVYYSLIFAPIGLHMERSITIHLSFFDLPVLASFLLLVALVYLLAVLYRRRGSRDAQTANSGAVAFNIWFFGLGWFFVSLSMVSGVIPINAVLYEHWLYVALIGPAVIIGWYLAILFRLLKMRGKFVLYWTLLILFSCYMAFLGYQSIERNILWGRPIEFYQDILRYEPDSVRINNNLGNHYESLGNLKKAEEFYQKAAENSIKFAQPLYNLGSIKMRKGDIDGALADFKKSLEIDPSFYFSIQKIIEIYAKEQDYKEAEKYMERLKQLRPSDPKTFYNSAILHIRMGDKFGAREDLDRTEELLTKYPNDKLSDMLNQVKNKFTQ